MKEFVITNTKRTDWRSMMHNEEGLIKLNLNNNIVIEKTDDETMIYNKETDSIIVLNITASYLYECIVKSINKGDEINKKILVDKMRRQFLMNNRDLIECSDDILKLLCRLIEEQIFYEYE